MQQKPKFIVFEKNEKWWQSIASDLFTYGLAFLLMLSSWFLDQTLWTIVSISIFFLGMTLSACESKAVRITTKAEALKWANSLDEDC